jgi:hypothetical protein
MAASAAVSSPRVEPFGVPLPGWRVGYSRK